MKVKIENIEMEDRFRKDFGDIEQLAKSIDEYGLIQPPVVTDDDVLVAGERRLRACKKLGWEEVEVRRISELPELQRREIELEENVIRKQFTWQEEVRAKEQIHLIKQIQHGESVKGHEGGWGEKETAGILDESTGGVHGDLKLARALKEYPELVEEDTKHEAHKKLNKILQEKTFEEQAEIVGERAEGDLYEIYNENCITWMQEQEDESFDVAIVDPPWGIEMDTKSAMSRRRDLEYEDSLEQSYLVTCQALIELERILKEHSHLYLYFGITNYALIRETLEDTGFEYDPIPLIWNKDHGSSAAKGRTYPNAYESVFFCYKGKRDIRTGRHNVFSKKKPPNNKRIHSAQKSIELQQEFIENSAEPGQRVIVPFAGSGSAVVASIKAKCEVVGLENDKMNFTKMDEFIKARLTADTIEELSKED